jgi:hypothetical protein
MVRRSKKSWREPIDKHSGEGFALHPVSSHDERRLETVDFDGLGIELKTFLLVDEKLLHILALIPLELDHLAHLGIDDDGAIAGEFLLDDLEDLLLVELLGQTLDCSQGFATIALCEGERVIVQYYFFCGVSRAVRGHGRDDGGKARLTLDTDVDVVLRLLGLASVFIGFREGVCD